MTNSQHRLLNEDQIPSSPPDLCRAGPPERLPRAGSTDPRNVRSIIPLIEEHYRIELFRKAIHLASIAIPIFYFYTPREVALAVFFPLTLIFLGVDVARYYHKQSGEWFYKLFGWLLRKHESDSENKRLNGATNVLIAATLAILIFPKFIAVTSFIILIISDLTAALVGRRFGKHPFFEKTVEGSSAFFFSALLVIVLTPKIGNHFGEYLIGALAAAVGTIIEALPLDFDDNLSIPMSVGATMWAAYTLMFPSLLLQ